MLRTRVKNISRQQTRLLRTKAAAVLTRGGLNSLHDPGQLVQQGFDVAAGGEPAGGDAHLALRESRGDSHRAQYVRRLDRAAAARGAAGDADSRLAQQQDDLLGGDAIEADAGRVGHARRAAPDDFGAANVASEPSFDGFAPSHRLAARLLVALKQPAGRTEADDARGVERAAAAVALLWAADDQGAKRRSGADEERADAFWSVDFVGAEREQIDAHLVYMN